MTGSMRWAAALLLLPATACGGPNETPANDMAATSTEVANAATAEPALPPCPFSNTSGWAGSVEGGRLLVTGEVDLQMAGFEPTLTPRSAAPGVTAFDLALTPEAGAAVTDQVRHEQPGSAAHRRGEVWCGGERVASFNIVVVG